jgi:hypothetical protein
LFFSHCKFTKICWRKQITEPDFIGGQGSLTKEEEMALSKYFSKKGKAVVKKEILTSTKKKMQQLVQA